MLDLARGLGRKRLEPKDMAQEHFLLRHLPYVSPAEDDVLMLRDGDVMASFTVEGIGAETAELALVEDNARAMGAIITQAQPDIGFYVHRISVSAEIPSDPPSSLTPFAAELDLRWRRELAAKDLRDRVSMVTIVVRPQRIANLWSRVTGNRPDALRDMRSRRISRLNEMTNYLMEVLRAARPKRLTLSGGRWLGLLRVPMTGTFQATMPGARFTPLADLLATSTVIFRDDTFIVTGADTEDMRFGTMFSIKNYPLVTDPGIFDRFDLPADMVLTQSFTPMEQVAALARIQRTIRQMGAADDAARSLREELSDAADDLASGRTSFGNHHATMAIFARSIEELDDLATMVRSTGQRTGGVLVREDIAARTAYFAQHPGNYGYRARAALISARNFADYAALHGSPRGLARSRTPWGAPVTVLPTVRGEPYNFNFHLGGAPGERTVGHTLGIGRTGSGKTLSTAFLVAQTMRMRPRIIVFDKDRGFEMAVRAMGGVYEAVRLGVPTGFNPFRAEVDERGLSWLTDWLGAMLSSEGQLTSVQSQALSQAAMANSDVDPSLRTLSHFRSQLRALDDGGDLFTRFGDWDMDGEFAWLFSGQDVDTLTFDHDLTGFDLTEIFEIGKVRTAWLSYVFRRIERTVEDERPTLIVLDEAWKLLDDPYFETRLKDWMLTMRKKNVAVVLLTQRVSHIRESRAGGSILESVATTILFPNSRNTPDELAPLNLTDAEMAFACSAGTEHRLALVRSGEASAVVDMDLSGLGPLLRVLGGGQGEWAPPGWRDNPDFWKEIPT